MCIFVYVMHVYVRRCRSFSPNAFCFPQQTAAKKMNRWFSVLFSFFFCSKSCHVINNGARSMFSSAYMSTVIILHQTAYAVAKKHTRKKNNNGKQTSKQIPKRRQYVYLPLFLRALACSHFTCHPVGWCMNARARHFHLFK